MKVIMTKKFFIRFPGGAIFICLGTVMALCLCSPAAAATNTPTFTITPTFTASPTPCGNILKVCPSGACGGYTTLAAAYAAASNPCDIIELWENVTAATLTIDKNIAGIRGLSDSVIKKSG